MRITTDQEKELREKLGIHLVDCPPPETWPQHLLRTFRQIRSFKDYDISTYPTKVPSGSSRLVWRNQTTAQAKRIAITARTTSKEGMVSEMEWRLRLEELVLARFRLEINCPQEGCGRRIWRSEVEAFVEKPGAIASHLMQRREIRLPCTCQPTQELLDIHAVKLNKIFSSRADQLVCYDPFAGSSDDAFDTSLIPRRRPDRIVGFQETESFDDRLHESCQRSLEEIACKLENEVRIKSIREIVKCTILSDESGPLLFPFLVIEAKSEKGRSFRECNKQSAFPIWKLLRIQEELHTKSRIRLEYGGPLIWYIAYRGDKWRVSGCYTVEKDGKTSYEILDLWNGLISEEDGALQLLLILDYIFDWARDVYKASIMIQLKALANHAESAEGEDDATQVATDPDIDRLSRIGSWKWKEMEAWSGSIERPTEVFLGDEHYDHDLLWGKLDSKNGILRKGVFRPACRIESVFECIYITAEDVHKLYTSIPKSHSAKRQAKNAEQALRCDSVLVSEQALSRMEEVWTNNARQQRSQDVCRENILAKIVYRTRITENWELERTISCLAFDEEAWELLGKYSERKTLRNPFKSARRLSERTAEELLQGLQSKSIQYNLAAALAGKREYLRILAGTSSSNPHPKFEFFAPSTRWPTHVELEVIKQIYSWQKSGIEELMDTYIRFSRHTSVITRFSGEPAVSSYFPGSVAPDSEDFVLVAYTAYIWPITFKTRICLYSIDDSVQPPSEQELAQALQKTCQNNVFYHTGSTFCNNPKLVYQKITTTNDDGAQKIRNATREWQKEMSQFLPPTETLKSQGHEPKSNGKRATTEISADSGKRNVLGLTAMAPPAHEAFEGPADKPAIRQPSQTLPGSSTPELEEDDQTELGEDDLTELEANITNFVPSRQESPANNPSFLFLEIANLETQSVAESLTEEHGLSSHYTPDQDQSHAEPGLHKLSTQDASPEDASSTAPNTPVSSPSAPSTPSIPSTHSVDLDLLTHSAAPYLFPASEHRAAAASFKRALEPGDDREVLLMRKRLKVCAELVDRDDIIVIE